MVPRGTHEPSHGLRIRVLGPLDIAVDGAPLVVDTRKAQAILALLVIDRRPFARDELAALLWPDADDMSAHGALRRTLSVLRAALGNRWLVVDRTSVRLDDAGLQVDLRAVERAAASSDLRTLRQGADAARGPLLAGFSLRDSPDFDDWRAMRATGAERTVALVLDRLVAAAEAAGETALAIDAAGRRVDLDPLDEAAHRRLMGLLARTGDRAAAIRQYRACVATLDRELGVAPLAETTDLYEAIRDARSAGEAPSTPSTPSPATIDPAPVVARPGLPMVGRGRELSAILEARRDAATDGRLLLVTGEAGIGKSRLLEAALEAVSGEGAGSLVARCYAAEAAIAYGPIVSLLRAALARPGAGARIERLPPRTLAELDRLVAMPGVRASPVVQGRDDAAGGTRLLEAVADGLTALATGEGEGAGLVAVEDIQWADEASRSALSWLVRRLAGRPLVVLLGWRPEDLDDAGASFADGLASMPGARHLALHRLDRTAVATLVDAAVAQGGPAVDPEALLDASEGLPLFVVEVLERADPDAGEGTARTVRGLIRERMASVSETGGQVLAAAAVIGRSFDPALVRATSGRTEDETVEALDELLRRGLVREVGDGAATAYDFAHARFRDAAYEALSLARRRLLHHRTAQALQATPPGRDERGRLALVAIHERAAGRDAEAAEAFRLAGIASRSVYALHEAGSHLETALALGHHDVARIQVAIGEIRTAQGNYAAAIAAFEAAAAVARPTELPGVELQLGRVHARRGDLATAASHLDAAVETLAGPGDWPAGMLPRALVERALVAQRAGDPGAAAVDAARALTLADAASDADVAAAAHRVLGLAARDRGDLATAAAELERSLVLAADDPDGGPAIAARNALALVRAAAGDHPGAIALLEDALAASRRTGERHLEAAIENNLADQLHAAGRPADAMVHLKRAVTAFAEVGGRPGELEPEIWKLVTW
jgi:DNA-binding SARP family transcriptional activator/tetratricopeptide (TPR) repeat protein